MSYRVNAIDAASGRALAPYDSAAGSVAEVFAEAKRRGVHVVSMLPLRSLQGDGDGEDAAGLPDIHWRMDTRSLIRLGKELPEAAEAMLSTMGALTGLVAIKPLLFGLAALVAGVFAAVGFHMDFMTALLLVMPLIVFLPLLASKLTVLPALRGTYDPGGRGGKQWLRIGEQAMTEWHLHNPKCLTQIVKPVPNAKVELRDNTQSKGTGLDASYPSQWLFATGERVSPCAPKHGRVRLLQSADGRGDPGSG